MPDNTITSGPFICNGAGYRDIPLEGLSFWCLQILTRGLQYEEPFFSHTFFFKKRNFRQKSINSLGMDFVTGILKKSIYSWKERKQILFKALKHGKRKFTMQSDSSLVKDSIGGSCRWRWGGRRWRHLFVSIMT